MQRIVVEPIIAIQSFSKRNPMRLLLGDVVHETVDSLKVHFSLHAV